MASDLRREADDLARCWSELERRIATAGGGGLGDVVALQDELRRTLADVSTAEITWARERIARLVAQLQAIAARLETVAVLKAALDRDAGS